MPDDLSARIETALTNESRLRLAREPGTEAGRRDLPARSAGAGRPGHGRNRRGWRPPGLSVPAARVLATAGAIFLLGMGGYEIATHAGAAPSSSSAASGAPAVLPGAVESAQPVGSPVNYGHGQSAGSIQTVTSTTNFVPSQLAHQATAAVEAARLQGVHPEAPLTPAAVPGASASTTGLGSYANNATMAGSQLASCISRFAPGHLVQLVEEARFDGRHATIIVTTAPSGQAAEVWVVGDSCSATSSDVLDHVRVARI